MTAVAPRTIETRSARSGSARLLFGRGQSGNTTRPPNACRRDWRLPRRIRANRRRESGRTSRLPLRAVAWAVTCGYQIMMGGARRNRTALSGRGRSTRPRPVEQSRIVSAPLEVVQSAAFDGPKSAGRDSLPPLRSAIAGLPPVLGGTLLLPPSARLVGGRRARR